MAKLRKNGPTSRKERRRAAELRQEYYNSLTPQQLEHLIKFGRKKGQSVTPSSVQKRKDDKPSRRERWEEKNKNAKTS